MYSNISLDTYDIFKEVYENKSLTKTAEKLNIAQSSISYRIKQLEKKLNIKLFNRMANGMEATVYADELYDNIKSAIDEIKFAERDLFEKELNNIGHIYIGVQHHIGKYFLTQIIKRYNELYSNIRLHIINKGTNDLVHLLENGKIDLMIDTLPINSDKKRLKINKIKELQTCFCKVRGAPDKFILPVIGSTMRTELENKLQIQDINIEPTYEIYTTEMTIEMIKQKMGIGYTVRDFLEYEIKKNIEYINIVEELPKLVLCMAYIDRKQSFAVNEFIKLINDFK